MENLINHEEPQRSNQSYKTCILCKANYSYQGYDIASSWFITKFDCIEISKALAVDVEDSDTHFDAEVQALQNTDPNPPIDDTDPVPVITQRVQCNSSPFSYAVTNFKLAE